MRDADAPIPPSIAMVNASTPPADQAVALIVRSLGRAQKATMLSIGTEWGPAEGCGASHQSAKRIWYRPGAPLLHHKHQAGNCWKLTPLGQQVVAEIVRQREAQS